MNTLYQTSSNSLEARYCESWQHLANVNETVENAPRCRRLESCWKVKFPTFVNSSELITEDPS